MLKQFMNIFISKRSLLFRFTFRRQEKLFPREILNSEFYNRKGRKKQKHKNESSLANVLFAAIVKLFWRLQVNETNF